MKSELFIRLLLAIFLFFFVFFYQVPTVRDQQKRLEAQRADYENWKKWCVRDSTRRANEIHFLDSLIRKNKTK